MALYLRSEYRAFFGRRGFSQERLHDLFAFLRLQRADAVNQPAASLKKRKGVGQQFFLQPRQARDVLAAAVISTQNGRP